MIEGGPTELSLDISSHLRWYSGGVCDFDYRNQLDEALLHFSPDVGNTRRRQRGWRLARRELYISLRAHEEYNDHNSGHSGLGSLLIVTTYLGTPTREITSSANMTLVDRSELDAVPVRRIKYGAKPR